MGREASLNDGFGSINLSKRTAGSNDGDGPSDDGGAISARSDGVQDDLPYTVELWQLNRRRVERVLGRASSAGLAQAIFAAAQTEHLGRRITLRKGDKTIAESS